jgi:hypothetical protein
MPGGAGEKMDRRMRHDRWHGRTGTGETACAVPGCDQPGEFRAPDREGRRPGFDGPGDWRWLCLDHVREFNAGYNFFDGMTTEEISAAQSPYAGWETETRAFAHNGSTTPRWADFRDPLDAIQARFAQPHERVDGRLLRSADRRALAVLGLSVDSDRRALRRRYAELVRRFHPDRNGGDRNYEKALQDVIAAYTQLKSAPAFA